MKKKIVAIAAVTVLSLSMSVSALAATRGYGYGGYCNVAMWDDSGNLLDKETYKAELDKEVADGYLTEKGRDALLEDFDSYSSGNYTRGGGRGCGGMRGYSR